MIFILLTKIFSTVLHPTVDKAEHYLSLYRIQRFSDHLLAKWVIGGRLRGSAGLFVPLDLLPAAIRGCVICISILQNFDKCSISM